MSRLQYSELYVEKTRLLDVFTRKYIFKYMNISILKFIETILFKYLFEN